MPDPASTAAAFVVLAGGAGSRVGVGVNKVFLPLAGRAAVSWSFAAAAEVPEVGVLLLVAREPDLSLARTVLDRDLLGTEVEIVPGGATRHGSEQAGLAALAGRIHSGRIGLVAIHDGARPLVTPDLIRRVLAEAGRVGGAVPVIAAGGLLRHSPGGLGPGSGHDLVRVQTPQAFRAPALLAAFAAAGAAGQHGTDTASTVEAFGSLQVSTVAGSAQNIKITYPDDVRAAERLLGSRIRSDSARTD